MQTPINNVIDFKKYKARRKQAEYYFFMTHCGAQELARRCGITHKEAQRLILKFIKKRAKDKK